MNVIGRWGTAGMAALMLLALLALGATASAREPRARGGPRVSAAPACYEVVSQAGGYTRTWGDTRLTGTKRLAQRVEQQSDATISTIWHRLQWYQNQPTDSVRLTVYHGGSTPQAGALVAGPVALAADQISASGMPWTAFVLPAPLLLSAGETYWYVITRTVADDTHRYQSSIQADQFAYSEYWDYNPANGGWNPAPAYELAIKFCGEVEEVPSVATCTPGQLERSVLVDRGERIDCRFVAGSGATFTRWETLGWPQDGPDGPLTPGSGFQPGTSTEAQRSFVVEGGARGIIAVYSDSAGEHRARFGYDIRPATIQLRAPWREGTTVDVGGSGYFYGQGDHVEGLHDLYAVDINQGGGDDDCDLPVVATAAGRASRGAQRDGAGVLVGYGNWVRVDHGGGVISLYAHLADDAALRVIPATGSVRVLRGQRIGSIGTSGNSEHCHLHFVVRVDGESVPPSPLSGVGLIHEGLDIVSNNLPPVIGRGAAVVEGDRGTRSLSFKVALGAPARGVCVVSYRTADGTAVAGSDYVARSGRLTLPADTTARTVQVTIRSDARREPGERFDVVLRRVSGPCYVGTASLVGSIRDDD